MASPFTALIESLRERAFDPERATDLGQDIFDRQGNPVPFVASTPISESDLQLAEAELGFRLPDLLREIYLRVGNGGFGPGYGLLGLRGGAQSDDGFTAEAMYRDLRENGAEPGQPPWPEGLLPVCDWGCAIRSSVDCTKPGCPVVRHDPNVEAEEEEGAETSWEYGTILGPSWVERETLQEWLEAWVAGERLFYRAYPDGEPDEEE